MFILKLFGGAVLEGPDGAVTGPAAQRRRLALLAVLAAAHGRPVGRERLIGLLWPEHPTDSARHLLSESLYILKKKLGEGAFSTGGDEVVLRGEVVRYDAAEFEAALEAGDAEGAARLYRGPFLDGVYVPDAPELERWVETERDRLARLYARAVERLAEAAEAEGRPLEAVEWWRKAAACDPYSSRVALRLMRALDAAGERAGALRAAETHAALLRADLEVEPDPEVLAYVEGLRAEAARAASAAATSWAATLVPSDPPMRAGTGTVVVEVTDKAGEDAGIVAFGAAGSRRGDFGRTVDVSPPREFAVSGTEAANGQVHTLRPSSGASRVRRLSRASQNAAYYGGLIGMLAGLMLSAAPGQRQASVVAVQAERQYDPRRIAVLYLDDFTPDHHLEHLAAGITADLIDRLGEVDGLEVIPINGVKPYRDGRVPLDSVVQRLRVGIVVAGSVQEAGGRLRIAIRVIDANQMRQLGSKRLEESEGNLFALLDQVTRSVADFLRSRLGEEIRLQQRRTATSSPAALDLVLRAEKAREDASRAGTGGAVLAGRLLVSADSLADLAAAEDPKWSEPVTQRGWVALARAGRTATADAERRELAVALRLADRALGLRADDPSALELRGTVLWILATYETRPDSSERLVDLAQQSLAGAVEAGPQRARAWSRLSQVLRVQGDNAGAYDAARKAYETDAFLESADIVHERLFRAALALERYDEARGHCAEGARAFPEDWRFVECELVILARDRGQKPDLERAARLLRRLDALHPPAAALQGRSYTLVHRRMLLASVLAQAGLSDSARAEMARARAVLPPGTEMLASFNYDEGWVRVALGERPQAARAVDEVVRIQPQFRRMILNDPLARAAGKAPLPPAAPR